MKSVINSVQDLEDMYSRTSKQNKGAVSIVTYFYSNTYLLIRRVLTGLLEPGQTSASISSNTLNVRVCDPLKPTQYENISKPQAVG